MTKRTPESVLCSMTRRPLTSTYLCSNQSICRWGKISRKSSKRSTKSSLMSLASSLSLILKSVLFKVKRPNFTRPKISMKTKSRKTCMKLINKEKWPTNKGPTLMEKSNTCLICFLKRSLSISRTLWSWTKASYSESITTPGMPETSNFSPNSRPKSKMSFRKLRIRESKPNKHFNRWLSFKKRLVIRSDTFWKLKRCTQSYSSCKFKWRNSKTVLSISRRNEILLR